MAIAHALLQFRPRKGRLEANLPRLAEILAQLRTEQPRPEVIVLPETALTGYFVQGGVREVAVSADELYRALEQVYIEVWDGSPLDIVLGFYERAAGDIFNSAAYLQFGGTEHGVRHIHRKIFLPTYGVFDEDRFVSRGEQISVFDTRFGRAAMLICEDAWHSMSSTVAALGGAEIIYVPMASPIRGLTGALPENVERWQALIGGIAAEHALFVATASLVGFEGGKGMSGVSLLVHPNGRTLIQAPLLDEAIVTAQLDLAELQAARYNNPLLADLRVALPKVLASLEAASLKQVIL